MAEVDHRRLGVDLFNRTWSLMETAGRSAAADDELMHCAHASAYHWQQVGTAANRARSEWLCSRVYTVVNRPEPALHHAQRCLSIVQSSPEEMDDWDLAGAYEALARAHATAGRFEEVERYRALGLEAAKAISDAGDRDQILADLATIPTG